MLALNNQTRRFHSPLIAACLCTQISLALLYACTMTPSLSRRFSRAAAGIPNRSAARISGSDFAQPSAAPVKLIDGYGRCKWVLIETIKSLWMKTGDAEVASSLTPASGLCSISWTRLGVSACNLGCAIQRRRHMGQPPPEGAHPKWESQARDADRRKVSRSEPTRIRVQPFWSRMATFRLLWAPYGICLLFRHP